MPAARTTVIAAVTALASITLPNAAYAAPCCGDQSGLGARLGRDESLSLVASFAFAERIGGYDGAGSYVGLGDAEERHVRFEQAIAIRANSRLEVGLRVPEVVGYRAIASEDEAGAGVGDPTAFARVTLVPVDDTTPAPALFASVSAHVPLGRPPWLGSPLSSDVTGQGAGEISVGVSSDKTWGGRWFAAAGLGVGFFTPVERGGARVQRGPRVTVDAATGPVFELDSLRTLACGVGLAYDGEVAPTIQGEGDTRGRFRLALTAPFAIDLTARWSLVGDVRCDLPADGAGAGDLAEVTTTLGVRFGARAWDL